MSDLIGILKKEAQRDYPPSYFDVRVLGGAAEVELLPVTNIRTFNDVTQMRSLFHTS